jgi:hypothetical protein
MSVSHGPSLRSLAARCSLCRRRWVLSSALSLARGLRFIREKSKKQVEIRDEI